MTTHDHDDILERFKDMDGPDVANMEFRTQIQTDKQPTYWRCCNSECRPENQRWFEFQSETGTCPKCGIGVPHTLKRALIHFIVRDSQGPNIGHKGRRLRVACSPKKIIQAKMGIGEAFVAEPTIVNCPGCMNSPEFQRVLREGLTLDQSQMQLARDGYFHIR